MHFATHTLELPDPGFYAARNDSGLLQVDSVDSETDAQRAGLQPGDVLLMADGNLLPAGPNLALPLWQPGQLVELQVTREGATRTLKFRVGVNRQVSMQIQEDPNAGADQLRVREGWLKGVTHPGKP